jgi:hypothetical protein
MIKITSIKHGLGNKADVTMFADTKAEVTTGMVVIGLPEGVEPAFGSSVVTASGEVAFLKSDGTWNWVGGES